MGVIDIDLRFNEFVICDPVSQVEGSVLINIKGSMEKLFKCLLFNLGVHQNCYDQNNKGLKYHFL